MFQPDVCMRTPGLTKAGGEFLMQHSMYISMRNIAKNQ